MGSSVKRSRFGSQNAIPEEHVSGFERWLAVEWAKKNMILLIFVLDGNNVVACLIKRTTPCCWAIHA